jgi:hypothetical protein
MIYHGKNNLTQLKIKQAQSRIWCKETFQLVA